MSGVLTTNGGAHPADKWADITAERLFNADDAPEGKRREVKAFQLKVAEIIEPLHAAVAQEEVSRLSADSAHLLADYAHIHSPAEQAVAAIVAASKGTVLEEHCARPEWQALALQLVGNYMATNAHVHRSIHADAGCAKGCQHSHAFRKAQIDALAP